MKLTTSLAALSLTALIAQSCSAQVCPLRKEKAFLSTLQKVDSDNHNLSCLSHPRKREWTSGYKFVTPPERVQFAVDYQEFLVSHGETGLITDFCEVPIVPYKERVSFAYRWWRTTDKTYRSRPPVDENWVHDALVDAGNSIHTACQALGCKDAERATANKRELDAVDERRDQAPKLRGE